jgi:hypothetical protein
MLNSLLVSVLASSLSWFDLGVMHPMAGRGGPPPGDPPVAVEVVVSVGTVSETVLVSVEDSGCSTSDTEDQNRKLGVQVCRRSGEPGEVGFSVTMHKGPEHLHLNGRVELKTSATTAAESRLGKDAVKVTVRQR